MGETPPTCRDRDPGVYYLQSIRAKAAAIPLTLHHKVQHVRHHRLRLRLNAQIGVRGITRLVAIDIYSKFIWAWSFPNPGNTETTLAAFEDLHRQYTLVRIPPIYSIPDTSSHRRPQTPRVYIRIGLESLLDLTLFSSLSSYASFGSTRWSSVATNVPRLQPTPLDCKRPSSIAIDGYL